MSKVTTVSMRMITAAALVAVFSSVEDVAGQIAGTNMAPDLEQAAQLEQHARSLYNQRAKYADAADLLLRASALRPQGDAQAADNLIMAGRLRYYIGDLTDARRAFFNAAERAVRNGQVLAAANAYIDAAFVAVEQERQADAHEMIEAARRLAGSPHLRDGERNELKIRIAPMTGDLAGQT
ncbi:MAG: hypothetical protein ACREL7_09390 [Longimicrobiales bacterium]